jgi:hypothetical protein
MGDAWKIKPDSRTSMQCEFRKTSGPHAKCSHPLYVKGCWQALCDERTCPEKIEVPKDTEINETP